jgi:EAL domain-containing protein (putative c-di-GMP-specific phosphodiesterase class I)
VPASSTPAAALVAGFGGIRSAYQPIVDLTTGRAVAFEALARFGNGEPPATVFEHARRLGLGHELEAAAVAAALAAGPPPPGTRLSINLSPSALASDAVVRGLPADLGRYIVEITENELVAHSDAVDERLVELRGRGALIAVDDAGAGYASLRQVMQLRPDIIKLDRSLVMDAHEDAAKRALIHAFVSFGRRIDGSVCAEGIERAEELHVLADLDVATGQGYLFARPGEAWPAVDPPSAEVCTVSLGAALRGAEATGERDTEATLETVGRIIAACTSFADLDRCVETTQLLLGVPEISISRVVPGPPGAGAGIVACAGPRWTAEPVYALRDFPATARVLASDEALQVLVSDPAADPVERDLLAANGYGALLLVPLVLRGVAVGTLEAYRPEERPWTRRQITLARAVAHQLALLLGHLAEDVAAGAVAPPLAA